MRIGVRKPLATSQGIEALDLGEGVCNANAE